MLSLLLSSILIINEIMASNAGAVVNGEPVFSPAYNFDSWIEVYNPGDQAVNLAGMYLSNSEDSLKFWKMPTNMGSIPAKGFKTIWLGSNDIKTTQAPFKLDCDGGTIYLSDTEGNLIVKQEYPEGKSRTSWARKTDGGEEWGWTADVTPGKSNKGAVFAEERLDPPIVSQGSTLFENTLSVKVDIPEGATLMYTTDGSMPELLPDGVSPWQQWIKNGDCEGTSNVSLLARNYNISGDKNTITAGIGVDGSRGIKVTCSKNAQQDHEAQLFVYTPDHIWKTGERYRFHMMVRADKAARMTTQTHTTPHNFIANNMFDGKTYDVGTEWMAIDFEGTITDEQVGKEVKTVNNGWWGSYEEITYKDMRAIAFNLNVDKLDNTFYFDNVSWETRDYSISSEENTGGNIKISETTNLTFRLFKDGYLPSVPVTRSYIKTSNKYTLPIVSIVGSQDYFTDPDYGFDCDGNGKNGKTGNGQNQKKNYNQDWDRPVNFSYISPEGEMLYNQDVNIKVSGGWTRSQQFRSFKLKASKIFDGQNRFDYSFFPQKPYTRNKTLLIRNGGNDIWNGHSARFFDAALETVIQRSGIDVDVQSYVPVIEYVNGQLRGVLNLREPNNDDFAYANWGYDDEELDAFENLEMKNGDNVAINRIFELAKNINEEGAYDELKTLLDIDEFTNYMAVTMFLDNDDWPNNNMKAYRSRNDGRYRFVSFDLDYAFALRNFNSDKYNGIDDPFTYFLRFKDASTVNGESNKNREVVRLFLNLMNHNEFRRKFIDTFCLVAGSVFEPTRTGKIVDELLANVKPMCDLMKQQGLNEGHNPQNAANDIKNKLKDRSKNLTDCLQKKFTNAKLSGVTRQTVTLNANTNGAHLYVNGLEVPYADFNGHLFTPVTLKAEAPAGYRFAGWKQGNNIISSDAETSLPSGSTVKLTATFTKLSDSEIAKQGITPVRINEVSANDGLYVNDYFKRQDWVELYNTTDEDIDVEGMYLTDNPEDKPKKYQIKKSESQASTIIPAHGFLIVWCDKKDPLSQLHASFKLDADGDELQLMAADESWTDRFVYTAHEKDQTVGRYPDGSNNVYVMNIPTIAKTNVMSSYAVDVQEIITGISETMAEQRESDDRIFNLKGQAVQGTLTPGIYIKNGKKIIVK